MDSFASELGVPFEIQMEARHVVDMDKQVSYYFVQQILMLLMYAFRLPGH
jgi:hypothetical protein